MLTVTEIGATVLPYAPQLAVVLIAWSSLIGLLASAFLFLRLGRRWGCTSLSYIMAGMYHVISVLSP